MRRILVEHARRKLGKQRGGDLQKVDLDGLELVDEHDATRILEVQEALERLEATDAQIADRIKLRLFSGLSIPQAAEVLAIPAARPTSTGITPRP